MIKKKIFIAVDTNKVFKAKKIIRDIQSNKIKIGYKFGLEFFYSKDGRKFLSNLKNQTIFLDLKLNDIPNTIKSALKSLKDLTLGEKATLIPLLILIILFGIYPAPVLDLISASSIALVESVNLSGGN